MLLLSVIIFFVLGLIIGSFLNVVIFRLNTNKSLGGRSGCMSCQSQLTWYELIPVLSFLGLGGRCRSCKVKISIQYPLVELMTGIVFALLFLKFSDQTGLVIGGQSLLMFCIACAYYAFVFSLLIVLATYDLRHKIIPDILSIILAVVAFVGLFCFDHTGSGMFYLHQPSLWDFLSGLLISLLFALFWLVSSGSWMGLGDAKLAVGLGWLLGFSQMLSATVLSFWSGAIIGIGLLIFSRKHGMKTEIPFAPYLVFGTFLSFIFTLHLF
jgi:prepilin signal peptidase PulO-like enzyme (type II secretory pathway)